MRQRAKLLVIIILVIACFSGCKFILPTSSDYSDDTVKYENAAKAAWDPYAGVCAFGCRENLQQPHLLKLINAGMLKGIRFRISS